MDSKFLEIIKTRRSCRQYKSEQITDEELKAVLEAGTYAPTSRGMQSPYIRSDFTWYAVAIHRRCTE